MSKNLKVETGESGGHSPGAYYREANPARVDITNSSEVSKWASVLEISEAELIDAVKMFGPVVRDIRRGRRNQKNEAA